MSAERVAALIPAAGSGTRLGKGPKALLELAGTSLLGRAVSAFEGVVDEIVVAVSAEMCAQVQSAFGPRISVAIGGDTRQQSVQAMVQRARAELVLIHDAARPFLARRVIEDVLAAVREKGAASVVMPLADSLIDAATGQVVDRAPLRAVQTPQGFRRELIVEAHERAIAEGVTATDDAALVRRLGHEVALVEGSSWLIKVTRPADWMLAEALANVWDEQRATR